MTGPGGSGLSGRVAVVTGGHDGVGYYIAEALLGEGMRVALLARRKEVLQQAAGKLAGDVLPVVCDIRDPDAVRAAFARVDEGLGRVSVLVNNAAVVSIYRIADASDEELEATVQTNLLGVMYCIREAAARMRTAGLGDIVNITSEAVLRPFPYLLGYSATKAAVETLSRGLKRELAPLGIRVGVLRSGRVAVPDRQPGARWDPERTEAFFKEAYAGGFIEHEGDGIDPRTTAQSVVHMLRLPRNSSIDVLELRDGGETRQ